MEEKIQKPQGNFFMFFIIIFTSFWLWFYTHFVLGDNALLGNKNHSFLESLPQSFSLSNTWVNLTLFGEVLKTVEGNFYSSDTINATDIERGMISGMVGSLGDKFSEYFPPEEAEDFENTLSGDFEWIGAVIEKNVLWVAISQVLKGSPALNNGLQKGDIIVEANGQKLQDMTVNEAVSHIKWPAWSKVTLKIIREWEWDFILKDITRDKIKIPSVDTKDIGDPEIGYISLNIFWENTSWDFQEILRTFNNPKVKWVIIDLRDNGGGYLQSAVEILSNFVEKWKVLVTTKYKNSLMNNPYYSENSWTIFGKKIVILINENTASASEITAWAMRDYNKAILVWVKSYGKWSVQEPFYFSDQSMLKLTIAKWYTPSDVCIDKNGINPDINVPFNVQKFKEGTDTQLEAAKEVLKKYIQLGTISLVVSDYEKAHPSTASGETLSGSIIPSGTGSVQEK